jgi:type III pantothenate kinase
MNLIIDVGNTLVKVAVFEGSEVILSIKIAHNDLEKELTSIVKKYHINKIIISSVGKLDDNYFKFLPQEHLIYLNHATKFPFKNKYKTPSTLGVDRLALISAAFNINQNQNTLVVDAGTCLTFDFIDVHNHYLGGAISPGLQMRFNALNHYTNALPLLTPNEVFDFVGDNTDTCIYSGVVNGMINEIDGIINQYKERYKDLTIILTGGDTNFLSKQLKSSIFANSNFLLEGLNYLLNFNLKE